MKPFTLPTAPVGPTMLEPLNLCLYGGPGIGKTPIACALPDCCYIDCQRGSLTYTARRADVEGLAEQVEAPCWEVYLEACKQFRAQKPKFLVVDTIGELGEWADDLAMTRFKASPTGKSWKNEDGSLGFVGFSILDLPGVKGSAGFRPLREAFMELLYASMGSWHRTIYIGHPRDKIAYATGTDPNVKQDSLAAPADLDLLGKMASMFTTKMAAIGYMQRAWSGQGTTVSFQATNAFSKTRCPHLFGRTLPFSNPCALAEWARIYPQTLAAHLLPEDAKALAPLLSQYGSAAAPAALALPT